jgi:hypothetical protein
MKKLCLALAFILIWAVSVPVQAATLKTVSGVAPSVQPEAVNTLLSAVTSTGDSTTYYDLGGTVSRYLCTVVLGGTIPTNVVVAVKGSFDGSPPWYDLIPSIDSGIYTLTPTEKVANGTFTGNATGWTLGAAWHYDSNTIAKDGDGVTTASQAIADMTTGFVIGETYLLNYDVAFTVAGTLTPSMCGVTGTAVSADGTYAQAFTCTAATGNLTFTPAAAATRLTVDNVKLIKNESGFTNSDIPFRYIKGSYVSKSGGGTDTSVTMKCVAGGN